MRGAALAALVLIAMPQIGGGRTDLLSQTGCIVPDGAVIPRAIVDQVGPADRSAQQPLVVNGAKAVFFSPTQAERDSIVRVEGLEVAQLFDDFDYYSGKVSAYLKRRGVGIIMTSSPAIVVRFGEKSMRTIERRKMADYMGLLLTDGFQEPKLLLGVASDEELIPECREYFRLK